MVSPSARFRVSRSARLESSRRQGVQLTPRDLSILRDIVRFGALTVEQIGRRHFGSILTAYGRLQALADAGYVRGERVFYRRPVAYVASRAGALAAATHLPPARLVPSILRHQLLVADLADYLIAGNVGTAWLTERELRAELMSAARDRQTGRLIGGVPHVPDGCLVHPDGRRVAVELECTPKWGNRYGIVLRFYGDGEYDKVRWFVEGAALRRRLTELVACELLDDLITVEPLPDVVRDSTWASDTP